MQRLTNTRANVSIELDTPRVPNDGKFYVLKGSTVVGTYRTMKQARSHYDRLTADLKPLPRVIGTVQDLMESDMRTKSNKQLLWTSEDYQRVQRKTWGKGNVR